MINSQTPEARLATARAYMSQIAVDLQKIFDPITVAGTLMGPALGVIEEHYGREKVVEYLLHLASEYEKTPDSE